MSWSNKDNETHWKLLQNKAGVVNSKELKAKTKNQQKYINAINRDKVTICVGPAGTGKTFIPCSIASHLLRNEKIEKIVITRPFVSCGEGYGFRPGTVLEKILPVVRPMVDVFDDYFTHTQVEKYIAHRIIEPWPLEDMRGSSLRNSFIICDEGQNATYEQLYMLLTRFASNSKLVVCGDLSQTDFQGRSPLYEIIQRLHNITGIGMVRLTEDDIVRDKLIRTIHDRLFNDEEQGDPMAEVWYKEICPACNKSLWWCNGDELDLTVEDVGLIRCWNCSNILLLPEDADEKLVVVHVEEDVVNESYRRPK